jgi:hypothetical protein
MRDCSSLVYYLFDIPAAIDGVMIEAQSSDIGCGRGNSISVFFAKYAEHSGEMIFRYLHDMILLLFPAGLVRVRRWRLIIFFHNQKDAIAGN